MTPTLPPCPLHKIVIIENFMLQGQNNCLKMTFNSKDVENHVIIQFCIFLSVQFCPYDSFSCLNQLHRSGFYAVTQIYFSDSNNGGYAFCQITTKEIPILLPRLIIKITEKIQVFHSNPVILNE